MKYCVVIYFIMLLNAALAQSDTPNPTATPSGAAAMRDANANLANATANVSVPLYTIELPNGASIPIGLVCSTSGIRVNDLASEVGLGWTLQAGGLISRTVRDLPDEQTEFYYDESYDDFSLDELLSKSWKLPNTELDIFYYSHPNGSDSFVNSPIWGENEGYTLPASDVSIKHFSLPDGQMYWVITDETGVKYTYGKLDSETQGHTNSQTREVTKTNSTSGTNYQSADELEYVSSWYLTKIQYPDLPPSQCVKFFYESGGSITREDTLFIEKQGFTGGGILSQYKQRNVSSLKLLSKIEFPKGIISFLYESNQRQDVGGNKKLSKVLISDHNGQVILDYSLIHSYFSSNGSYYKGQELEGCSKPECKRLRLDGIYVNNAILRSFVYDDEPLPPLYSYYTDHYGYYNGGGHHGLNYSPFPSNIKYSGYFDDLTSFPTAHPGEYFVTNTMSKEPALSRVAGSIREIVYPSGGRTVLNYTMPAGKAGLYLASIENRNENYDLISGTKYSYLGSSLVNPNVNLQNAKLYYSVDMNENSLYNSVSFFSKSNIWTCVRSLFIHFPM